MQALQAGQGVVAHVKTLETGTRAEPDNLQHERRRTEHHNQNLEWHTAHLLKGIADLLQLLAAGNQLLYICWILLRVQLLNKFWRQLVGRHAGCQGRKCHWTTCTIIIDSQQKESRPSLQKDVTVRAFCSAVSARPSCSAVPEEASAPQMQR